MGNPLASKKVSDAKKAAKGEAGRSRLPSKKAVNKKVSFIVLFNKKIKAKQNKKALEKKKMKVSQSRGIPSNINL